MEMNKEESGIFSGGFTLIELLIVISITAILIAIATPSFVEWRRNLQYKEAAEGMLSTLRTAKSNAVTLNLQNRVEIQPGSTKSKYRITQGNRAYNSTTWDTVKQDWVTLPDGVLLRNGDCTGSTDVNIQFSPNGTASADTVCIRDNTSEKYKIFVAASGRIRNVKQ